MQVRRYKSSDYETLVSWMTDRDQEAPKPEMLPKLGWIIPGYVCAFLMKTDSKIGLIEYFQSNPLASDEDRLQACDILIRVFEKEALRLKMKSLVGSSYIPKVIALALRSGFVTDGKPYYFVRKKIGEMEDARSESGCKPSAQPSASE